MSDTLIGKLVVADTVQPLSTEDLLKSIENNQLRIMFLYQNDRIERAICNIATYDFAHALQKHPPIYYSHAIDESWYMMDVFKEVSTQSIALIVAEEFAVELLKQQDA